MQIKERSYSATTKGYRFGFNGQEGDDEVSGEGNSYTAEFWQYDSRLGKRWNMDPRGRTWESPYAVLGNNPLMMVDPKGDKWGKGKDKAKNYQNKVKDKISDIEADNSSLNDKLDQLVARGKGEKRKAQNLRNRINGNDQAVNELVNVHNELSQLERSDITYNILDLPSGTLDLEGYFEYDAKSKEFNIYAINFDLNVMGHELKHAYQFEERKLSFKEGGAPGTLYDVQDEVEAFKRQRFLYSQGFGLDNLYGWYEATGSNSINATTVAKVSPKTYGILSKVQLTVHTPIPQSDGSTATWLEWQKYVHSGSSPFLKVQREYYFLQGK